MNLAVNITDARGREMKQLDPLKPQLLPRRGAIDDRALRRIVEEIQPGAWAGRRLAWMSLALGVVALLGMTASLVLEGRSAWNDMVQVLTNPATIAFAAASVIWLPFAVVRQRRSRRQRVLDVMLRHLRCPHCGYSLTGLPVDPGDGATVCPECAGAWRVDDAAPPRAAAAAATLARRARWLVVLALVGLALSALGLLLMYSRL